MKEQLTSAAIWILVGVAAWLALRSVQEQERANALAYRKAVALEYYVELQERELEGRKR